MRREVPKTLASRGARRRATTMPPRILQPREDALGSTSAPPRTRPARLSRCGAQPRAIPSARRRRRRRRGAILHPGATMDDGAAPPAEARDSAASSFSLSSDSLARSRFTAAAATWSFLWSSMIFSPSSSSSSRARRVFSHRMVVAIRRRWTRAPPPRTEFGLRDRRCARAPPRAPPGVARRLPWSPLPARPPSAGTGCGAVVSGGRARRPVRRLRARLVASGDGRVAHLRLGLESLVGHLKHVELGFLLREFTRHLIRVALRDGRVGEVGISAKTREARIERRATARRAPLVNSSAAVAPSRASGSWRTWRTRRSRVTSGGCTARARAASSAERWRPDPSEEARASKPALMLEAEPRAARYDQ